MKVQQEKKRPKILITDDSKLNRLILADMLAEEFDIIEAEDGRQAVAIMEHFGSELSLVLLDVVMPNLDGFGVLAIMNKRRWIETIPVIMITAETTPAYVERAFELGVTDYISRPFDALVVRRRAINTTMLYARQKRLVDMVADQIYEREKSRSLMVSILSHIVEFRNSESGMHVLHIQTLTELLCDQLSHMTNRYDLSQENIARIVLASPLHDIGKIAVPEEILNKPGRLTKDEYEIIKTHSAIGAEMLENIPFLQDEPLVQTAYKICRWHHERYDGKGYPDGLVGDNIPIAAQIVALADVYDALTSPRVYKPALPHQKALQMICGGECGAFNPILLDCLLRCADQIEKAVRCESQSARTPQGIRRIVEEINRHTELSPSERMFEQLEQERTKSRFFASMSREIHFEYTRNPPMLALSEAGAKQLGLRELILNPLSDEQLARVFMEPLRSRLLVSIEKSTPEQPVIQLDSPIRIDGEMRWHRFFCRSMWSADDPPRRTGVIGKLVDIHEEHQRLADLQHIASHDALTGLYDRTYAKKKIIRMLQLNHDINYALLIVDLDGFKNANDTFGHLFGDKVLQLVATRIRKSIRRSDIAARISGDEFLIFVEYTDDPEPIIKRIFDGVCGVFEGFNISISIGVSCTPVLGREYEKLYEKADEALYHAKRAGRGRYCFAAPGPEEESQ